MITRHRRRRITLLIVLLFFPLAFVYVHIRAYLLYASIELGMDRETIVKRLGEPRRIEPQMIFCAPYFPWTGACPADEDVAQYLFFKVGIDRWIIVGFSAGGSVVFLTLGDT